MCVWRSSPLPFHFFLPCTSHLFRSFTGASSLPFCCPFLFSSLSLVRTGGVVACVRAAPQGELLSCVSLLLSPLHGTASGRIKMRHRAVCVLLSDEALLLPQRCCERAQPATTAPLLSALSLLLLLFAIKLLKCCSLCSFTVCFHPFPGVAAPFLL